MKNTLLTLTLIILLSGLLSAQTDRPTAAGSPAAKDAATETKRKIFRATREQIRQAQTKLREQGVYKGAEDGRYNRDLRRAIGEFQSRTGLRKTGGLNRATLEKMDIELTDRQKEIPVDPRHLAGADERDADRKPRRKAFRPTREQITQAQEKLSAGGLYRGEPTGRYSPEFRRAVRDFQSANGLKRKGSLNRATLEKMDIELTAGQREIPVNPDDIASSADGKRKKRGPVFRATKAQITEVQNKLQAAGLYQGEATGRFNDDFRAAIRQWQEANGVKKTGTLNRLTLEKMGIELTDRQKDM